MKLKVCGMKYQENIVALTKLQPDYMGFIFYDKSSRYVDGAIPTVPKSIKKTGVFVNEEIDKVIDVIKKHQLQAVQLHGEEPAAYCKKLRRHYEAPKALGDEVISSKETDGHEATITSRNKPHLEIIKVFSIKYHFNFEVLKPYEGIVDYFLFDTKGKLPGGNGYTFDWKILNNYPSKTPYFLSGGIGLDTLDQLKAFQNSEASKFCYAIDVNSKFETAPGLKRIDELEEFINNIKK